MKKKIAMLLLSVIVIVSLSGCTSCKDRFDSPAEMLALYKECRATSPDTMRALGKYFALYGYDYYLPDKSARDVSWNDAMKLVDTMNYIPKLTDTVDTVKYYSDDIYLYYKVPTDHAAYVANLQKTLMDAGFVQTDYDEDKKKESYRLVLETYAPEGVEKKFLKVIIKGYPQQYSASHNVSVNVYYTNY